MIAIIDYGVGNLFSLERSFSFIGEDVVVTGENDVIDKCDRIILPGVGAFADAAKKLKNSGLDETVKKQALSGKPILGICLGMQLLFEKSYEYGEHDGLGLIKGNIKPIENIIPKDYKIPHIGWNRLTLNKEKEISPIYKYIKNGDYVYFVHSYYLEAEDEQIVKASTDYITHIHASVESGNVFACQFHPEKSGDVGLQILKNFAAL